MIKTFNKSLICEFPAKNVSNPSLLETDVDSTYSPVAKVISAPSESFINDGDIIMYWAERKHTIDGTFQNRWLMNEEEVLQIPDYYVQAKVLNAEKAKQSMLGLSVDWDHGVDTVAVNNNVLLNIIPPAPQTKDGIIMPKFEMGRNATCQFAEVLSVGPDANSFFAEDTLKVGQTVILQPMPAGGDLPSRPGQRVWRCPAMNILAILDKKEGIIPLGGNCIVEPFTLQQQKRVSVQGLSGSYMMDALETESGVLIPSSTASTFRTGKVFKAGTGWSEAYRIRKGVFSNGNMPVSQNDWILLDCFNHEGKPMGEVFALVIDGKSYYFMNSMVINVKLDESVIVSNDHLRSFEVPSHHYIMNDIKGWQS